LKNEAQIRCNFQSQFQQGSGRMGKKDKAIAEYFPSDRAVYRVDSFNYY